MSIDMPLEEAPLSQLQQTPIDNVLHIIDEGLVYLPTYRELYYRWERPVESPGHRLQRGQEAVGGYAPGGAQHAYLRAVGLLSGRSMCDGYAGSLCAGDARRR